MQFSIKVKTTAWQKDSCACTEGQPQYGRTRKLHASLQLLVCGEIVVKGLDELAEGSSKALMQSSGLSPECFKNPAR